MRPLKILFYPLLILLLGHYPMVLAQPYAVSVQHYGTENGLAHRETNTIIQDRQGFIWIATKGGLSRFDGKTFTTYNRERSGFAFDDIGHIAEDADGKLWLAAMERQWEVMIFDPQTGKVQTFAEKFGKSLPVFANSGLNWGGLTSSPDGTVFLTSTFPTATLLTYHPKTGLRQTVFSPFKTLSLCHATRRGTVWAIADRNNMVELHPDGRVLRQYKHAIRDLNPAVGSANNEGLFFYLEYPGFYPFKAVYSIDEQGNRRHWPDILLGDITSYNGAPSPFYLKTLGLVWENNRLIDPQGKVMFDLDKLGYQEIDGRGSFQDRSGRLWFSNNFGINVLKLAPSRFKRLFYDPTNKLEALNAAAIRGIQVVGNAVYFNREAKGLYKADRTGRVTQTLFETRDWGAMYGLARDRQGRLVAGAHQQFLQTDTARRTVRFFPLPNELGLWSFYAFSDTHLLAGADRGLRLIDARTGKVDLFRQYNQFPELAQAHTLHIGPDRQGTIWLCATTGLYTFDPRRGITARYWSGGKGQFYLPAESFQHVYHAPNGLFWLATANRGLVRWDRTRGQSRAFRRADGLSNDNIYAVYADRRGHLWLSSDYGIMQFDPVRQTTRTYLLEDGIGTLEFNRISHFQEPNGRIYFGGLNGITTFDPRDFENERPPEPLPLYLTAFRQFDPDSNRVVDKTAEVKASGRIRIPPGDGTSVLDFAFLNFDDAVRNVYAYQIVGLGEGWVYQPEPTLRLSNLPYGAYQLQVKAQAANGQWSANPLTLELVVLRPVYLRTWFLALLGLLAGAGVWGWARWRSWAHRQEQQRLKTQVQLATARIEQDNQTIARQAETLQQLDQTKSRFFANISHEFRTPLTVILGMAGELKTDSVDQKPGRLRQVAELIERNGTNLLRLINQILDLSKIEAGEMTLKRTPTDLVGFVRYVGESFHSMASQKEVALQVLTEPDAVVAEIDKDKVQDVLANLLANAIRFTPMGGQVTCELRITPRGDADALTGFHQEIRPTANQDGPWFWLHVRDTGPGIAPESLPRIFDRFYQVNLAHDPQGGGTGIGLAFVRELVALMQGGLAVRSGTGQGAEFVVSLPLKTPQELAVGRFDRGRPGLAGFDQPTLVNHNLQDSLPKTPQAFQTLAELDRPLLLLAEDNDDVAHYIQTCVEADYRVIRAENGQRGIDLAREHMPDLVVSDVMMPLKDGFELCDTLKTDPQTSHIPVVLLTARAALTDRLAGLRRGADAYLVKPFEREELRVVLANLLQTRQRLQQHYAQLALGTATSPTPPNPAPPNPALPDGVVIPTDPPADVLENEFLQKLRATIEARLDDAGLSVEVICHEMGMSRTSLHGKLTALTGMSMSRYLRALRLGRAKTLLTGSDLNVSEVAYAVGFDDPKYFSRVFSEEFGVSPGQFRAKTVED